MTQAAVRKWLADTLSAALTPLNVQVFDKKFKSAAASDIVSVFGFESEENQLSFGNIGSQYAATYRPDILILLHDPNADEAQDTLDTYTKVIRRALGNAPGMTPITDPVTSEASTLAMVGPRIAVRRAELDDLADPGEEGDILGSVLLSPTLVELAVRQ